MGLDSVPRDPQSSDDAARRRLDRSLASGLAWTGLVKWGAQLLSWASTLVIARLLAPTDYGIIGMAGVYLVLVQQVSEFGLGVAVIQQRGLDRVQIARLGGLAVIIGVGLFLLSAGLAPTLAAFYGEPAVSSVLLVGAGLFVVSSFQVVPSSLLAKELAFRRLAIIEAIEALTQTGVTIALALSGARYWALMIGPAVARTASTIMLVLARPHPLAWPRNLKTLREPALFGWRVVVSRLTWYVYSNSDFLVIGRLLGAEMLGAYTLGWNIASVPVEKIGGVLSRVTMPVLSVAQDDRPLLARYFLLGSEALALLVLPASIGLTLVAPDFVPVVLGPRWLPAVIPLQALSAHATLRCLNALASQAILALGDARQGARAASLLALILPVAFVLAATKWGINGVAFTWLVVYPLISVPLLTWYAIRRIGVPPARFLRALWPALSSAGAMTVVVFVLGRILGDWTAGSRLTAEIVSGALTYGTVLAVGHRKRIQEIIVAARGLWQSGSE